LPLSELGQARSVYLKLLLNDAEVAGVMEAEVGTSDHQIAGWFRVTLALGADSTVTAASLSLMTEAVAEIRVGLAGAGLSPATALWQSLIAGTVDTMVIDMAAGTAHLTGRDFSALFIDTQTAESFANRTASEIAQTLAVRHGLDPVVTTTQTPVGRYYQDGHDLFSLYQSNAAMTEWDLLHALAEAEGFDLFVQDKNLFFAPPLQQTRPTLWQWMPGGLAGTTMSTLRLERSLALARDIVVTVQSWNSREARMVTQTIRASALDTVHRTTAATSGNAATYVLIRPNLSAEQALTLATNTLADLSRHERVILATMPGELDLAPRSLVTLEGTATDFDQTYVVDEIVRRISSQDGFMQTVRCVNTPLGAAA
jgi:phage protein D